MLFKGVIDKVTNQKSVYLNQQELVNHRKKSRFEWGHGGNGPADLAYYILYELYGKDMADKNFQIFKWDRLSTINKYKEWTMDKNEVDQYVTIITKGVDFGKII